MYIIYKRKKSNYNSKYFRKYRNRFHEKTVKILVLKKIDNKFSSGKADYCFNIDKTICLNILMQLT
ncbi:MAG: hypothetical protein DRP51_08850 [Candidatus Zixiibacteriota bacterium]|nr:MAG: hypothetical protein DRP51_08850 [candidate division Zixibacteria bacterium]